MAALTVYCTNAINSDSHSHTPSNCPKNFGQSQVTEGLSEWVLDRSQKGPSEWAPDSHKRQIFFPACRVAFQAFGSMYECNNMELLLYCKDRTGVQNLSKEIE
jgi:hypothetical protein